MRAHGGTGLRQARGTGWGGRSRQHGLKGGDACSTQPPRVQRGKAGNEGLWGHTELPTPPKAGHQRQSPQGMLLKIKVWEQQQSPRGRKQEGRNLGPTSRDGGGLVLRPRLQRSAPPRSTSLDTKTTLTYLRAWEHQRNPLRGDWSQHPGQGQALRGPGRAGPA